LAPGQYKKSSSGHVGHENHVGFMGVYLGTMSFTPHSQGFKIVLKPTIIVDHAQQGLATIVAKFKMRHVLPHRNTNQV